MYRFHRTFILFQISKYGNPYSTLYCFKEKISNFVVLAFYEPDKSSLRKRYEQDNQLSHKKKP